MKKIILFYLVVISSLLSAFPSYGQVENIDSLINVYLHSDSMLLDELEADLNSDSLTIYDLIDSLMYIDFRFSQLSLRIGYTSNITNAGRNFGIEQHGITTGISYYHKTGLFGDLSGYWNSEISPHYNPTIATLGYMGSFSSSWNFSLSYDHFFYHHEQVDEDGYELYYPLTNSMNLTSYYDVKSLTFGADYAYLFGKESAHRLRGYISLNLSKNDLGFIERLVFLPTASVLLGNQKIYYVSQNYQYSYLQSMNLVRNKIGRQNFNRLWRNDKNVLFRMAGELREHTSIIEEHADNVFGIMNYSLSAPIFLYFGNFNLTLSYHLNIPVALPGENISLEPNSYFGCAIMYSIPFLK